MNAAPLDPMSWLPTDDTPLDVAAVAYAQHGHRVAALYRVLHTEGKPYRCECRSAKHTQGESMAGNAGKHPVGLKWQELASSDPAAVAERWRLHPKRNIGMVMGGPHRLVALDVDGPVGRESLAQLEVEHGPLPQTLTSSTGREDGGEHRIFHVPDHLDIAKLGSPSGFRPKLDAKCENGQIAVAPSIHYTGRKYRWTVRAPIADIPEWLYDVIAERKTRVPERPVGPIPSAAPRTQDADVAAMKYVRTVVENACKAISAMREGGRNDMLFAKSCTVFEYHIGERIDHTPAWADLMTAGTACGLSKGEVHATLSKAWAKVQGGPGKQVPVRPAPPLRESRASNTNGNANSTDAPAADGYPADWQSTTNTANQDTSAEPWWDYNIRLDKTTHQAVACEHNAVLILRGDPRFKGRVQFDEFTMRPLYDGKPFTDAHEVAILIDLQFHYTTKFCQSHVRAALKTITDENRIDTLKMAFDAYPEWDKTPRLDTWLVHYLGVEDSPYTRTIGRKWLIQAVARVYAPGCKADATLMLIGLEGIHKSQITQAIGGAFFTDQVANINDELKAALSLHGKHIIELAEMAALKNISNVRAKQWLSQCSDHYTPKYMNFSVDVPRRCVFLATTNEHQPLIDTTGNRRFWPVVAHHALVAELRTAMPQLWAEAIAAYRAGEQWWLDATAEKAARDQQEAHRTPDVWEEAIGMHLRLRCKMPRETERYTTVHQIMEQVITTKVGMWTPRDQARVVAALRVFKWTRHQVRTKGGREWRYLPPEGFGEDEVSPPKASIGDTVVTEFSSNIDAVTMSPVSPMGLESSQNGSALKIMQINKAEPAVKVPEMGCSSGASGDTSDSSMNSHPEHPQVSPMEGPQDREPSGEAPFADWFANQDGDP